MWAYFLEIASKIHQHTHVNFSQKRARSPLTPSSINKKKTWASDVKLCGDWLDEEKKKKQTNHVLFFYVWIHSLPWWMIEIDAVKQFESLGTCSVSKTKIRYLNMNNSVKEVYVRWSNTRETWYTLYANALTTKEWFYANYVQKPLMQNRKGHIPSNYRSRCRFFWLNLLVFKGFASPTCPHCISFQLKNVSPQTLLVHQLLSSMSSKFSK